MVMTFNVYSNYYHSASNQELENNAVILHFPENRNVCKYDSSSDYDRDCSRIDALENWMAREPIIESREKVGEH